MNSGWWFDDYHLSDSISVKESNYSNPAYPFFPLRYGCAVVPCWYLLVRTLATCFASKLLIVSPVEVLLELLRETMLVWPMFGWITGPGYTLRLLERKVSFYVSLSLSLCFFLCIPVQYSLKSLSLPCSFNVVVSGMHHSSMFSIPNLFILFSIYLSKCDFHIVTNVYIFIYCD